MRGVSLKVYLGSGGLSSLSVPSQGSIPVEKFENGSTISQKYFMKVSCIGYNSNDIPHRKRDSCVL